MERRARQQRRQRGIATLEFLIVAPLLLLVVLAVSELGWAFHQYQTLTRAARDGARHLATNARIGSIGIIYLDSTLVEQTGNLVVYGNVGGSGAPLLPGWSTTDVAVSKFDAEHVSVVARYAYVPMVGNLPTFYGGRPLDLAFELRSTVQMRAL